MKRFSEWVIHKWRRQKHDEIKQAYHITFSTFHGRIVLEHLLSNVYCTVYEGNDPIAGAVHHGRRSVVHEILEVIDQAERPEKYEPKLEETDVLEVFHG